MNQLTYNNPTYIGKMAFTFDEKLILAFSILSSGFVAMSVTIVALFLPAEVSSPLLFPQG